MNNMDLCIIYMSIFLFVYFSTLFNPEFYIDQTFQTI